MKEYGELISVVITTHNRKEKLIKAIESVLMQTYPAIECIVVDDASTDDTIGLLHKKGLDSKVKYIYNEKSYGGNHARNIGWRETKGEWIAFLDDDDEWYANKIEEQVKFILNNSSVGIVYCGRDIYEESSKKITPQDIRNSKFEDGDLSRRVLTHIICVTSSIIIQKNILSEIGGFDEQLQCWQEYEMCIRAFQKVKVGVVRNNLFKYYVSDNDKVKISNKFDIWEENVKYIYQKHAVLMEKLSTDELAERDYYRYIDGIKRAKASKRWKKIVRYLLTMVLNYGIFKMLVGKIFNRIKICR